ncbi:type II toxin-antitoxin system Phd/YefM family antitoxin [Pendulispora rubella]|uniref:Antitoxin n=1 Tax=Pendulispora rubella TaxID=2741070 RepID=A0ABZ2LB07_9BACT
MKRVSVAEAKNRLPALIHAAEETGPVEILRHDKPVAVLVAHDEYERLRRSRGPGNGTWDAIMRWREKHKDEMEELDLAGALEGTRGERPARAVKW